MSKKIDVLSLKGEKVKVSKVLLKDTIKVEDL